ncbi:hypothetical protein SFC07_11145 [Corynebacterium callunae]|uniref:hypothetical protein n=1 Tax=Corynebacterium callunae TaxID=1721 RepID=UPI003982227D
MNTPAAMPKKATGITKPVTSDMPALHPIKTAALAHPSRQQEPDVRTPETRIHITTTSPSGIPGELKINGRPLPCLTASEFDIELNDDGSGVVWVGLMADRIIVNQAKPRKK